MAAILARSTTASAVVSARRSQAEQPCVRRSVSAAAWQKAITEADLEKADVSNSVGGALFLLSFFRKIKTAVSLFGNRNWENKALGLIDAKDRIECAARRSGPRAKIPTPRSKKLSLSLLAIFLSRPRPAPFSAPTRDLSFLSPPQKKKKNVHRASAPSARSPATRSSSPRPAAKSSPSLTSARTSACRSSGRRPCCRARSARSAASSASPARRTARRSRSRTGLCRASGAPSCPTCRWLGSWARGRRR